MINSLCFLPLILCLNSIKNVNNFYSLSFSGNPYQVSSNLVTNEGYSNLSLDNTSVSGLYTNNLHGSGFVSGGAYGKNEIDFYDNFSFIKFNSFSNNVEVTYTLSEYNSSSHNVPYSLYFELIPYDIVFDAATDYPFNTSVFSCQYSLGGSLDSNLPRIDLRYADFISLTGVSTIKGSLTLTLYFYVDASAIFHEGYNNCHGLFLEYFDTLNHDSDLTERHYGYGSATILSFFQSYSLAFSSGYYSFVNKLIGEDNSFNNGYNVGLTTGYNNGYDNGYSEGGKIGYDSGYKAGIIQGKNLAYEEISSGNDILNSFSSLLSCFIKVPFDFLNGLSSFTIFNIPVVNIALSIFLFSILIYLIGKVFLK